MDITLDEHPTGPLKDNLPDCARSANGMPATAQNLTIDNLEYILNAMGYAVRWDEMRGCSQIIDQDGAELQHRDRENAYVLITNECVKLGITNTQRLESMMDKIAADDVHHPFLDWIRSAEWDGQDRLQALRDTLEVQDDGLVGVYLRKWLIQAVEGAAGWETGKPASSLPHVLVLTGAQGKGKTSWFRTLGGGFMATECELHLNSPQGKDHQIAVLSNPMAELSEIDSTFRKSDISSLKAFLSRPEDTLRAPYGRRAVTRRRMTAFCGSVNDKEFLADATGSRRFWPIHITSIDFKHDIDVQQLWAQAYSLWLAGESYVLTEEEEAARSEMALERFSVGYAEAIALEEQFSAYGHNMSNYIAMPLLAIMRELRLGTTPPARQAAKRWLEENLGPARKVAGRKNTWAIPVSTETCSTSDFVLEPNRVAEFVPEHLRPEERGSGSARIAKMSDFEGKK